MVNNTFIKMVEKPMKIVIKTINQIQDSNGLSMFENFMWNKVYKIREKLNMTKIQSQLIILRFQDMQDWQFLNQRKLKRKNIPF